MLKNKYFENVPENEIGRKVAGVAVAPRFPRTDSRHRHGITDAQCTLLRQASRHAAADGPPKARLDRNRILVGGMAGSSATVAPACVGHPPLLTEYLHILAAAGILPTATFYYCDSTTDNCEPINNRDVTD